MPDNPGAWLVTTARHRAIDRLRRDRVLAAKLRLLAQPPAEPEVVVTDPPIPDERLELVFMCCHPALALEAQVALTLRAVAGLATEEIARAFLVPAETATTVRVQDGRTLVTDGPFADTKEIFAGFYLVEADDLDQATELAARIPAVRIGGSVEIRPVVTDRG